MCPSEPDVDRRWWKESFVYQIYPQSFNDTDGDGLGDIRGIIERLDYLDDLGVDIVWVNPLYESPHVDNGYDIADYRSIKREYGRMSDFDELLYEMHDRDIRLIMDLVVNHTSDQHAWFQRSRAGEEPYDDYYWWVDGEPDDDPPNNWTSGFGGSAWEYDDEREAYYLHLFDEAQPDLNWENPAVREDVYDMITWWLEKGIDGFRMDVFNLISKPPDLPDGDEDEGWVGSELFANGPKVHDYVSEMVEETFSEYDVMTVGEAIDAGPEDAKRYCGPSGDGLSMVFHYEHILLDFGSESGWWEVEEWELSDLREVLSEWQRELDEDDAWNTVFLGTHDWPRIVSRFGDDDRYRRESAKLLATFLFSLQGTPYVYQGDEIGMTNYPWTSMDQLRDADARNRLELALEEGDIDSFEEVQAVIRYRCRDNARTPMQWDDSEHAGFTDGEPWIDVNPNHEEVNVADARADPDSVWHYYRDLIDLRHDSDLLVYGDYELLSEHHSQVWAFARTLGDRRALVVLNWSDERATYELPGRVESDDAEVLVANYDDPGDARAPLSLRPYEARIYER
ncbi:MULTISPECIES: glycoside hydrolase family 13 protein [Haloarcula]|uniref:glycoside hydrolase family 13 protein n=1 Tax=Haloarcula TaxID=2237 RepID=UPI0023ED9D98|nr:alpha-glucosidase [Halomicroarcula sp. XH51]